MRERIALIDTHVHFFDRDSPWDLRWEWVENEDSGSLMTSLGAIAARRFGPSELAAEAHRSVELVGIVHVQAALGSRDPVEETRWMADLRSNTGQPGAAIAFADLTSPHADSVVAQHAEFEFVRGIRDPDKGRYLTSDAYVGEIAKLGRRGLAFEITCGFRRFGELARVAQRCADTTIVINHLGVPPSTCFGLSEWGRELRAFEATPNVHMKISGFGTVSRSWTDELVAVWIETVLDVFTPRRCVVGSNWPVDRVAASYPDVISAVTSALAELSASERGAVLIENAKALYRPAVGITTCKSTFTDSKGAT